MVSVWSTSEGSGFSKVIDFSFLWDRIFDGRPDPLQMMFLVQEDQKGGGKAR
jgi:hypothetical protein